METFFVKVSGSKLKSSQGFVQLSNLVFFALQNALHEEFSCFRVSCSADFCGFLKPKSVFIKALCTKRLILKLILF
jgi:hypothetical protein